MRFLFDTPWGLGKNSLLNIFKHVSLSPDPTMTCGAFSTFNRMVPPFGTAFAVRLSKKDRSRLGEEGAVCKGPGCGCKRPVTP